MKQYLPRPQRLSAAALVMGILVAPRLAAADAAADQVYLQVNQQRIAHGDQPLARNSALDQSAQEYAAYLVSAGFFSHYGPDGSSPVSRMNAAGYTGATFWGENIAAGQPTADAVMTAWMNSPEHAANILQPGFTDIGIGVAYGGDYGTYWVQDFGGGGISAGSAPTPTPTTPPAATPTSPPATTPPPTSYSTPTSTPTPPSTLTPTLPLAPTPTPAPALAPTPSPAPASGGSVVGASLAIVAIGGVPCDLSQATVHVGQPVTLSLQVRYSSGFTSDVSLDPNTRFLTDTSGGVFDTQNVWSGTVQAVDRSFTIYGQYTSLSGQQITTAVKVIVQL